MGRSIAVFCDGCELEYCPAIVLTRDIIEKIITYNKEISEELIGGKVIIFVCEINSSPVLSAFHLISKEIFELQSWITIRM